MWKYVTRRLRDTLERSANHFDKRSSAGVVNSNNPPDNNNSKPNAPSCWFSTRKCWNSYDYDNNAKSKRWNFEDLNRTWLGAITWSSALVFGWYSSQLLHLKLKNELKGGKCINLSINSIFSSIGNSNVKKIDSIYEIENNKESFPVVKLISNEFSSGGTPSNKSSESSDDDLGEVLNSIENRLGLAAIENGQHKDGLNLLRSAANRHHAPALYNLGLCYEQGLGVDIDEKAAMELYRSAAALQHPGALYNLGIYYGQGRGGLNRDSSTATRLLRLAAVQGQEDAIAALNKLSIDVNESSKSEKPFVPFENEHMPTQSKLFVHNVNTLAQYNYEPIVY
ncbi:unnamed protein product [Leptidea sinapis]|uniref:Uncharacterized protein n=1 Tax=Leptidea sinapis TaxID=189913 RepID=A0A5E4QZT8_9NEOP|nr:unnamed protein product [Leptidea sinapis]